MTTNEDEFMVARASATFRHDKVIPCVVLRETKL